MAGKVLAVDQENVLPAVAIVIDECAARAQSFRQVFFPEGAVVVDEVDAGGFGDVGEADFFLGSTGCCQQKQKDVPQRTQRRQRVRGDVSACSIRLCDLCGKKLLCIQQQRFAVINLFQR